ncbi:MAG: class I SAM-dependent methyltransferase [Geminicoccaceae bacterium]
MPPTPEAAAALAARVAARYRDRGRFARYYVAGKLRHDPALAAILALGPLGEIVDLGCGRGQLGLALLEAGAARNLHGLDWDEAALADASAASGGLPARFTRADLARAEIPGGDTVMLIDALYQLPAGAQPGLLDRAAAAARKLLLVRALDPERGWRSRVGLFMEGGLWVSGRYRRAAIRPMPVPRLRAALEAAGFAFSVEPCWGRLPLPNVLVVARRR